MTAQIMPFILRKWDMERPLRLESSVRTGKDVNGKLTMFFSLEMDQKAIKCLKVRRHVLRAHLKSFSFV